MIETTRLIIIPATIEMLKTEINDKSQLPVLLDAIIPKSWPPETLEDAFPWFAEQLERNPEQNCWYCWYAILKSKDILKNTLVGSVGFKGGPDNSGTVEIGYSVLNEYQGKSIAQIHLIHRQISL
jgi:ribosomal-protein-alanine N-acetyltransferase